MNKDIIMNFCGSETEEFHYMIEVAKKIEEVLGSNLSLDEAVSLYGQLSYKSFICSDGFIINDYLHKDLYRTLGNRGASAIAASLYSDSKIDYDWFYWNYGNYLDTHKIESILPKLTANGNIKENLISDKHSKE